MRNSSAISWREQVTLLNQILFLRYQKYNYITKRHTQKQAKTKNTNTTNHI